MPRVRLRRRSVVVSAMTPEPLSYGLQIQVALTPFEREVDRRPFYPEHK